MVAGCLFWETFPLTGSEKLSVLENPIRLQSYKIFPKPVSNDI